VIEEPPVGVVDVSAVAASVPEPWKRVDLVTANDAIVRLVRLLGDFPWHEHDEDELFLCWEGAFRIESRTPIRSSCRPGSCSSSPAGSGTGRWPTSPR
jgi:hypothetical protein